MGHSRLKIIRTHHNQRENYFSSVENCFFFPKKPQNTSGKVQRDSIFFVSWKSSHLWQFRPKSNEWVKIVFFVFRSMKKNTRFAKNEWVKFKHFQAKKYREKKYRSREKNKRKMGLEITLFVKKYTFTPYFLYKLH